MVDNKERTKQSIKLLIEQSKNGVNLPVEIECNLIPTIIPNDLAYYIIQELGSSAFTIYYMLYSQKGENYDDCSMSIKEICDKTLLSRSTVTNTLTCLVDLGVLKIKAGGRNHSNRYFFPMQTAEYTDRQLSEINMMKRKNTKKKE